MHGEEVRLIAQFRDEGELMLDGGLFRRRHALRPAPACPGLCQPPQVTAGGLAGWHELVRVLVAQLLEAEVAGLGDLQRGLQQARRIEPLQAG